MKPKLKYAPLHTSAECSVSRGHFLPCAYAYFWFNRWDKSDVTYVMQLDFCRPAHMGCLEQV